MASVQFSSGSCPVEGLCPRLNHHGEATALSRADPTTSIPGTYPGIIVHDHCLEQGLPELASETKIGPCNYHREGTTFVDSIEHYLSRGTHLSPADQETFQHRQTAGNVPFRVHSGNRVCRLIAPHSPHTLPARRGYPCAIQYTNYTLYRRVCSFGRTVTVLKPSL